MLTSTALVLFMTIPGLSLFYAGMVRAKNVLSVMMQCFAITCADDRVVDAVRLQPGVRYHRDDQGAINLATFIGGFGKAFLSGRSKVLWQKKV
jgi:Amt family ammonium transporter